MMSSENCFALFGILLQGARKRQQAKDSTTDVLAGLRFLKRRFISSQALPFARIPRKGQSRCR
jgi:hypothetical protein